MENNKLEGSVFAGARPTLKRLATGVMILAASGIVAGCPKKTYPPIKSPPNEPCRVYCGGQTDNPQKESYVENDTERIYHARNSDGVYMAYSI